MLPTEPLILEYYVGEDGDSPFERWYEDLDRAAAAKVRQALSRLSRGNLSNAKAVGEGVLEYRINWGPGYRMYFGLIGARLVVLLVGGTKQRQQRDIASAKEFWANHKRGREAGGVRRLWH